MNSEMDAELVLRLKAAVKVIGNAKKVAADAGIPQQTFANHLSGRSQPKATHVAAVAKATGVSIAWLLTGIGPMLHTELHEAGFKTARMDVERDLLASLADGLAAVHKEANSRLSPGALMRLALQHYDTITASAPADQAERSAMVKHAIEVEKRALIAPVTGTESNKRSA